MKIMYVSDAYIPSKTANSVHVVKMAEALALSGHKVKLMALSCDGTKSSVYSFYGVRFNFDLKFTVIRPLKGVLIVHALNCLIQSFTFRPDFVFGRSFFGIALISIFRPGLPLAFETHNPVRTLTLFQKLAFEIILKRARSIIVISAGLKEILVKEIKGKFREDDIFVFPDAASLTDTSTIDGLKEVKMLRSRSRMKVGYVGSVQKGRGIEVIVTLAQQLPDVDFYIVGATVEEVLEIVSSPKISPNLLFLGFQSPAVCQLLRSEFDVLVAPYQLNTSVRSGNNTSGYMSPLKIFEYMSAGKAIIASDMPVIREVLSEHNSILINPTDIEGWVNAINRLRDVTLRKKLGRDAYHDWKSNFSWETRAEKILNESLKI
jgi:glycosyltransferase involved in cell wall biosynthesis